MSPPVPSLRVYAILFAIGLAGYGGLAWDRLGRPSIAPHYVLQADAWLHGRATIDHPSGDDWARVETVLLRDGREVSGRRSMTRAGGMFRALSGERIPVDQIASSRGKVTYNSFPPLPTLLMIPSAIVSGEHGNNVIPTILVAAAILPLALLVLRTLASAGLSKRELREDLWLVAALAFGSVLWFSAIQGSVWFCAHVIGVALALVYAWASIARGPSRSAPPDGGAVRSLGAQRPIVAGLALGAAALTRPPMAFMFPLFALEAWRAAGGLAAWRADAAAMRRALIPRLARFAAPVVAFGLAGMAYNYARFASPTEFGHTYLEVRQQAQIEQFGLFSYHYLARNLAVAFTLLPEFIDRAPWIQVSGHGLALWLTTPLLAYLVWPRDKPPIHRALWITVVCVALPSLFYQNSGWVQFGYRFSLDYLVFLIMLIAIGGRSLGRVGKALIVFGVAVNLFGALTFDRAMQYYRTGGDAYDVVVRH